ncbi:MAG: ParB N-terminal domain-containing protein [Peptoclostridium sp.]|uniref:ParB/RepB/Spo0J family partition protein n=1 Tax=Peptoclostridium sp. TaxID=1904860 RepID=UPI00139C2D9F|nr:ParB N-terminal domain-containing protein [Peptoclostridium sp.]MZQ74714.1 ParB N-terminal domain-containing protein [Peptoclostridium sp.]
MAGKGKKDWASSSFADDFFIKRGDTDKDPFGFMSAKSGAYVLQLELELLDAAPQEWNFYKPLAEDKMDELIESIEQKGLLHPIVVWERAAEYPEPARYTILSGHNRVEAFRRLYESTGDRKYAVIMAHVKKPHEIDEEQAKEIVIDTNWVSRQLSAYEKSQSIIRKYMILGSKEKKAHANILRRDIIAKEYNITGRQVDNYRKLSELIEPFQEMLRSQELGVKAGVKLTYFDSEMQQWIYDSFGEAVCENKIANAIKAGMGKEELSTLFNPGVEKVSFVKMEVPAELRNEFIAMAHRWLKSKTKQ